METEELLALINLLNVKGVGPQRVNALVRQFTKPSDIFSADEGDLCQVPRVDVKTARRIKTYSEHSHGDKLLNICQRRQIGITTLWDDDYPELLKKIYDPPSILYWAGQPLEKQADCLSLVGSRKTTNYGRSVAQKLTREVVEQGLVTVSGLARGIDSVVHDETVKQGGRTIAVLGSGVDVIYPASNRKLVDAIQEQGTIISEFIPGTKPEAGNFPQRNRIISGLGHGVVVVEAGNRSGAILTALNAIDQNREVFAVPGRINDAQSVGCLRLIRHGAVPATGADVIMDQIENRLYRPHRARQTTINLELSATEARICEHLSHDPVHIDDLVRATEMELTKLLAILLEMELRNIVVQLSGKQFVLA